MVAAFKPGTPAGEDNGAAEIRRVVTELVRRQGHMHIRRALFGVAEELGMSPRRARAHYHEEVGEIHDGELELVRAAYAVHLARRRVELTDEVGEVDAYLAAYGLVARPEPPRP